MGHNDDWIADDNRFKQPRGLFGASLDGSTPRSPGGSRAPGAARTCTDPARGPLNNGGLYGERAGWHLPGYPGRLLGRAAPRRRSRPGVTWLRTHVRAGPAAGPGRAGRICASAAPAGHGYRVLIFLNGWNLGQYGGDVGPQTDFVLPAGLLRAARPEHARPRGRRTAGRLARAGEPGRRR